MQSSTESIVAAARRWVGTPYRHATRLQSIGVDCVGLILGVGAELGYISPVKDLAFSKYMGYARTPNPSRMRQGMVEYLRPAGYDLREIPPDGCIGWFEWRQNLPMHLAIVATYENRRTMIHAYSTIGRCVENSLDEVWLSRVNSWWQYQGSEV